LDAKAQKWAEYLAETGKFEHSPRSKPAIGENVAMQWSMRKRDTNLGEFVKKAINDWYNEEGQYNYNSGDSNGATLHFTQVVWKSSEKLGLGIAINGNSVYIVGNYFPAGNHRSRYLENVKRPV